MKWERLYINWTKLNGFLKCCLVKLPVLIMLQDLKKPAPCNKWYVTMLPLWLYLIFCTLVVIFSLLGSLIFLYRVQLTATGLTVHSLAVRRVESGIYSVKYYLIVQLKINIYVAMGSTWVKMKCDTATLKVVEIWCALL